MLILLNRLYSIGFHFEQQREPLARRAVRRRRVRRVAGKVNR